MILPTKHIRTERAVIGVGAEILRLMQKPKTVSRLWDDLRARRSVDAPNAPIDYNWFVLALDLLFMLGAIKIDSGVLIRVKT